MTEAEKYLETQLLKDFGHTSIHLGVGKETTSKWMQSYADEQVKKALEEVEDSLMSDDSKSFFCEDCKHTIDVKLKRNPCKCVECGGKLQR